MSRKDGGVGWKEQETENNTPFIVNVLQTTEVKNHSKTWLY